MPRQRSRLLGYTFMQQSIHIQTIYDPDRISIYGNIGVYLPSSVTHFLPSYPYHLMVTSLSFSYIGRNLDRRIQRRRRTWSLYLTGSSQVWCLSVCPPIRADRHPDIQINIIAHTNLKNLCLNLNGCLSSVKDTPFALYCDPCIDILTRFQRDVKGDKKENGRRMWFKISELGHISSSLIFEAIGWNQV